MKSLHYVQIMPRLSLLPTVARDTKKVFAYAMHWHAPFTHLLNRYIRLQGIVQ